MRLPRRVPWRHIDEVAEVCSWIYSESSTDETRLRAVQRLAAWKAQTELPHALEATWMLLNASLNDSTASKQLGGSSTALIIRLSYSMAIVRLVNGLVDPLQQGVYARSISSIATQIGLPLWLVEIRHAATHEDLPSLDVLREATDRALDWLLHHYWIPTVAPSQVAEVPIPELPPLSPLLKEYKNLVKQTIKDASLKSKLKSDILKNLRQLERWIGEVKVAYGISLPQSDDEEKESYAIDQLCEGLLDKGFLLPKSKKKRNGGHSTEPSNLNVWEQMIQHLQLRHLTFAPQLHIQIGACLFDLANDEAPESDHLSGWLLWLVDAFGSEVPECSPQHVATTLMEELSRSDFDASLVPVAEGLIQRLPLASPEERDECLTLLQSIKPSKSSMDIDVTIETMEERLLVLSKKFNLDKEAIAPPTSESPLSLTEIDKINNPAPGLRRLVPETGWKPCPIGVNGITGRTS